MGKNKGELYSRSERNAWLNNGKIYGRRNINYKGFSSYLSPSNPVLYGLFSTTIQCPRIQVIISLAQLFLNPCTFHSVNI